MDFIYDENLVSIACGSDRDTIDYDASDVIYPGVRRGVDFEHIQYSITDGQCVLGVSLGNFYARGTDPAWFGSDSLMAVKTLRQDASGGGLPHAASAR